MPTTCASSEASHSEIKKKHTFLGNVFGKMNPSSSNKKTPRKTAVGDQSHVGTVKKLFPFSGGKGGRDNTRSTPHCESVGGSKKSRLVGLVASPTRLFRTSEELIPASRGVGKSQVVEEASSIKVVVRVRPRNEKEQKSGVTVCSHEPGTRDPDTLVLHSTGTSEKHMFSFDTILSEEKGQKDVFEASGSNVVENCLRGFNGCLLAYGQTGSGKTYSMMGDCNQPAMHGGDVSNRGIIQRSFEQLFEKLKDKQSQCKATGGKMEYSISCSFIEIYNEALSDLTNMGSGSLVIRDDPMRGIFVEGVEWHPVYSMKDIERVLFLGMSNRRVEETLANDRSSRSHSVFTATITQKMVDAGDSMATILRSQLHLVDLAGSERQKSSGAAGERLKEASNINKSLSALGHVIMSLVDVQQGKQRHVPYRDSKLTFLLQDALGGSAKTVLLATISPASLNAFETLSTLRFADNVKRIKNKSVIHQDADGDVESLRREVIRLRQELAKAPQRGATSGHVHIDDDTQKALMAALAREEQASRRLSSFQQEISALQSLSDAKEADLQRTKMMLRLKESRITRSQVPHGNRDEIVALENEIDLLKQKIDSHPEVKRFALENIRLRRKVEEYSEHMLPHVDIAAMVPFEELEQLRTQLLALSLKADKAEEEARVMKAEATAAKEILRTAEKKREQYESTEPRMQDEQARVKELESELDDLRVFSNQQATKIVEYDELCAHAGDLDSVVEQLTQRCKKLQLDRDDWYDAYTVLLGSMLQSWNIQSELKKQVINIQCALEEETRKHSTSYEKAKNRIAEAVKSATMLQEDLDQKCAIINDLENAISDVSKERDSLSVNLCDQMNAMQSLREEHENLSGSVSQLKHTVETQMQDIEAHVGTIDSLGKQLSDLEVELSEKSRECSMIEKERNSLQAALASAQIDAQMAESQLKEKSKHLAFSEESESELRATIISLQEEISMIRDDFQGRILEIQNELQGAKEITADLESELNMYKNKCTMLTGQLKTHHEMASNDQEFKKERTTLQMRIKELEDALKDAEKRSKAAEETNTGPLGKEAHARNISQKLRDAEDTVIYLRQEVASLKSSIKTRDETLAKLRNQMAMEVNDAAQQVQELLATQARAEALEKELSKLKRSV